MASKTQKTPVHGAVYNSPVGALAKSRRTSKPKTTTKTQAQRNAETTKARAATKRQYGKDHAKARKMMATNKNKREGTYSNYDPLSSVSTKKAAPKKATKKVASKKAAPKKRKKNK